MCFLLGAFYRTGKHAARDCTQVKNDFQCVFVRFNCSSLSKERLVRQVAILNSCANMRGKGRGDLSIEVLEVAADVYLSKDRVRPVCV